MHTDIYRSLNTWLLLVPMCRTQIVQNNYEKHIKPYFSAIFWFDFPSLLTMMLFGHAIYGHRILWRNQKIGRIHSTKQRTLIQSDNM